MAEMTRSSSARMDGRSSVVSSDGYVRWDCPRDARVTSESCLSFLSWRSFNGGSVDALSADLLDSSVVVCN